MYGYRLGEVSIPYNKLNPVNIKSTMRIVSSRIREGEVLPQVPISRTLPIFFTGAANCKPDPNYPPNVVLGVLGRVGMEPPKMSPIILSSLRFFVDSFCSQFLTPLEPGSVDFYDWIEGTPYPQKRREELKRVWDDNPSFSPSDADVKIAKSFIKDEPYGEYKLPRSINSRSDWFKCFSGPLFQAIGTVMFHSLPEFIKTVPVRDQPQAIIQDLYDAFSPVANNDATSYEAHFIKQVMCNIEFVMYFYMCRNSPSYMQVMEEVEKVLTGEQDLKFKDIIVKILTSLRLSGEMNTSLGNGFTTMILVSFIAWVKKCLVRLKAEGDDNLSAWQFESCVPTEEEWKELGWVMKVERPESVCTASFCGNVFDIDDRLVIVDPRNALLDFGWVKKQYVHTSDAVLMQLMRSKALSMFHQYNGCPMLGIFARHVIELTKHVTIRASILNSMSLYEREEYLSAVKDTLPEFLEPSASSRELVYKLYNISYEEQIAFESSVRHITLWSSIELNFLCSAVTVSNYENYSCEMNVPWVCQLDPNRAEVERLIRSFGKVTDGFVNDYY